ncbi:hypothetical protein QQ045_000596 [Rhodiola kirilowii]
MVFLTSCWFIIEKVIVPEGYVKWFCLSYFIYPAILVFVQMFVFLEKLTKCLLLVFSCLVSFCGSVCEHVIRPLRCFTVQFRSSFNRGSDEDQFSDSINTIENQDAIVADSSSLLTVGRHEVPMAEDHGADDIGLYEEMVDDFDEVHSENDFDEVHSENDCKQQDDEPRSNVEFNSPSFDSSVDPIEYPSLDFMDSPVEDYFFMENPNGYLAPCADLNFPVSDTESDDSDVNSSIDPFYIEYTEKMRWFDMLNHDRNSAMDSVKKSINTGDSCEASVSFMPWQNTSRKDLLRSLEYEFEKIYVGQLCLSWEALHHQYRMVEDHLANSSTHHGFFYTNVAGEFQKFHVLLNRFMEDEWGGGKRYLNYVQRRFLDKSFLQVPQVSGFYEEAKHGTMGEAMNDGRQVLKAIQECVKTYCEFVKTDKKRCWWKLKSKLWTLLPVEGPRDCDLLVKVIRMLQLKEFFLKDLKGKKRCWCNKRVTTIHVGDFDAGKEMLFSIINLKLVRRVLDLYIVTTPQLNWCKDKLDNITFMGGSVATISFIRPMFPP